MVSQVNPNIPLAGAPLDSGPIRQNFQHIYSELSALEAGGGGGTGGGNWTAPPVATVGIGLTIIGTTLSATGQAAAEAAWGAISGTLSAQTDLNTALNARQATLVSGTNIRTVGGQSLLGSGDVSAGAQITQAANESAAISGSNANPGTIYYWV